MQKTTIAKKEACIKNRKWYTVDATDVVLGDLAVAVANLLRGKNKPDFTPAVDCGDYVVVTNANKVKLTGNKMENKKWYSHSMYIGGLRTRSAKEMYDKYADEMVTWAVEGMLPKNKLGKAVAKKLLVYKEGSKDHSAQNPIEYRI
ncbi:MAG: 50S ribosomal protein L13 [Mycoplasmataceae bacterium]|nr:50S ribosomal protein L13 [Mycoplasmataceae bacterium]